MASHDAFIAQFIAQNPPLTAAQAADLQEKISPLLKNMADVDKLANALAKWCMDNAIRIELGEKASKDMGNYSAPSVSLETWGTLKAGIENILTAYQGLPGDYTPPEPLGSSSNPKPK